MSDFWLAPLHGITVYTFRNCLFRHAHGIKTAVTPFFPIQEKTKLNVRKHADFRIENNLSDIEIIPQLIGSNPDHFVDTVNALNAEFGYTRFNWNVGCPMKQIVRKRRGCGLMPYPQMVDDVVNAVTSKTPFSLSVKMRIGLNSPSESIVLLDRLNAYPLDFVAIHPRLGVQQYDGLPDMKAFSECLNATRHKVIYSGDIQSVDDFIGLKKLFPQVWAWMLGRGILANPFLAEQIERAEAVLPLQPLSELKERFAAFYADLLDSMLAVCGEHRVMANMKELWHYFARFFSLSAGELQNLLRITDFKEFEDKTKQICEK